MADKFNINITIDKVTASHILGGLAQSWRQIPASAPASVASNLKFLAVEILNQLENQGVGVTSQRSGFRSYVNLFRYETYKNLLKLD